MKPLFPLLCLALALAAAEMQIDGVRYRINDGTGAVASVEQGGKALVAAAENHYLLMSPKGDATGLERDDQVTATRKDGEALVFTCANPKLPGVAIAKRYFPCNGGLRRTLEYHNGGQGVAFLLTFTELHFPKEFRQGLWHLGAGYIGPYKPFPQVDQPRPVNEYRQSSKGMVLVHPDGRLPNFCHYRVKINEQVVLPWWHSTIGHYREYADRLWYLPDGYRMGLGTLDLQPGKTISVTDFLRPFPGDLYSFFEDVFARDQEVMAEIRSIPPGPAWLDEVVARADLNVLDYHRWLLEMIDDGFVTGLHTPYTEWCDYRVKPHRLFQGAQGGTVSVEELRDYVRNYNALSPRVKACLYHIVISASKVAPIFKERPEWFRPLDRNGKEDSLFPGLRENYQTMFNYPECRQYLVDMLSEFADYVGAQSIYLDEAQMTSTIDWQRLALTRDDHTVLFWKALKARADKDQRLLWYNGSGLPYADLNYMESPHELAPRRWRDWVGVAWGIGMMNRLKPGNRACPLYWSPGLDYVNRILALGWIPALSVPNTTLPSVRATFESGNLLPVRVRHSPDWMQDASVEVESHTMRRADGAPDRLLSYISRAAKPQDIPVAIDLGSLGFAPEARINLWRLDLVYDTPKKPSFILADREVKANWKDYGWNDGRAMTVPHLVYSGPAKGEFKHFIHQLPPNAMVQFLATTGPALFSVDGLPLNYYYTAQRKARLDGKTAVLEKPADILLIDCERHFTDVTVDGKPIETRPVDIGGTLGLLVPLPPGRHTLAWQETGPIHISDPPPLKPVLRDGLLAAGADGTLLAIELHGRTVCTAPSPVKLPPQYENGEYRVRAAGFPAFAAIRLTGGQGTAVPKVTFKYEPEAVALKPVQVRKGEVAVTRTATWTSRHEEVRGLQTGLNPCVAEADPRALALVAGTSRREAYTSGLRAFAGFELDGARQVRLRFRHTFGDVPSLWLGHVHKSAGKPETNFTGIVLDYRVGGKYTHRVALSTGLYHAAYATPDPIHWGTRKKPDLVLELGDFINGSAERVFSLDLERLAPKGWDGTVFLSVGTARVLPNRRLHLQLLGFNDKAAQDFLTPELPLAAGARTMPKPLRSKRLAKAPASLNGKLDPAEWQSWRPFTRFQPTGTDPKAILRAGTRAFLAHDYEYIYLAVEAAEPGRAPVCDTQLAWRNERIELLLVRPDQKLYQVLADAQGKTALFINGLQAEPDDILCKAETVPGKGWRLLLAVPVDALKFDMQRTPVVVKANLCRARLKPATEYSSWAPVKKAFNDTSTFGTLIFDFE